MSNLKLKKKKKWVNELDVVRAWWLVPHINLLRFIVIYLILFNLQFCLLFYLLVFGRALESWLGTCYLLFSFVNHLLLFCFQILMIFNKWKIPFPFTNSPSCWLSHRCIKNVTGCRIAKENINFSLYQLFVFCSFFFVCFVIWFAVVTSWINLCVYFILFSISYCFVTGVTILISSMNSFQ